MNNGEPISMIANLMAEIFWEGSQVTKKYRDGGRGFEDILTTKVLLADVRRETSCFTYYHR